MKENFECWGDAEKKKKPRQNVVILMLGEVSVKQVGLGLQEKWEMNEERRKLINSATGEKSQ